MADRPTWRCYFCDEVFTTPGGAADHFGATLADKPGCLIDFQVQVEAGVNTQRGRGLLMALRKAEAEMARYREEDTDLHREIYRLKGEHATALQREEEKGYARGLRDGVNLPADSPERASIAGVTVVEPQQCKHLSECTDQLACLGPEPGCRRARGVQASEAPTLREAAEQMVRCAAMWENAKRADDRQVLPLNVWLSLQDLRAALGVGQVSMTMLPADKAAANATYAAATAGVAPVGAARQTGKTRLSHLMNTGEDLDAAGVVASGAADEPVYVCAPVHKREDLTVPPGPGRAMAMDLTRSQQGAFFAWLYSPGAGWGADSIPFADGVDAAAVARPNYQRALAAVAVVDKMLLDAGYLPESSARQNLEVARSSIAGGAPAAAPSEDLTVKCLPQGVLFDAFGEPRKRYTRVIADGSTCVCDEAQLREWQEDEARNPGTYVFQDVYLSDREFEDLPEFDGF